MTAALAWEAMLTHFKELSTLRSLGAVLSWDQQTNMPPKGAALRGEQMALISGLAHERFTQPRVGDWLEALEAGRGELDEVQLASLRNVRRSYDREVRVSGDLMQRLALAQSEAFGAWVQAKENSDFSMFSAQLSQVLALVKERVASIDESAHPYDVLLEGYDPGTTMLSLKSTFSRLRESLVELLDAIRGVEQVPAFGHAVPIAAQKQLHQRLIQALGFDLQAGRMDEAPHPFTVGVGPGDVRLTTRYAEAEFLHGLTATIHETGHGLYEQGLPHQWRGTFLDSAASVGLHESQSRFWENFIGRSEAFFSWFQGPIADCLGEVDFSVADLYAGANRVAPGLIRVTADEVTYNLHIIVRFELEVALLEGSLAVDELPQAWEQQYLDVLGLKVPNLAQGVLQDVHWSYGAFGYFPSYTLGNLYAASLGVVMQEQLPELWQHVACGDFSPILSWLRQHVHAKGHLHDAPNLMKSIVGDRDVVEDLVNQLWSRQGSLYGVSRR